VARISATKRFKSIFPILEEEYGRREDYGLHPPIEQVLLTLLLKNGEEAPAERAINRLRKEFVNWNEARVSQPEALDRTLGNGYPPGIGQLIVDTLTAIFNRTQSMNLDDIVGLDPDRAESRLNRLRLLPSRVVGEFLLTQLDYDKLPPGAGLLRVAARTKLVRSSSAESRVRGLRQIVPKKYVRRAFHAFEMLGERVCTPRDYDCRSCPIVEHCPTGVETVRRLEAQEEKEREARDAERTRKRRKRRRDRKEQKRRRAATARLRKTIEERSKKLKITPSKTRKRRKKKLQEKSRRSAKMVQASSADVKPDEATRKKRRRKSKRKKRSAKKKSSKARKGK
jgi:endonuclease III